MITVELVGGPMDGEREAHAQPPSRIRFARPSDGVPTGPADPWGEYRHIETVEHPDGARIARYLWREAGR